MRESLLVFRVETKWRNLGPHCGAGKRIALPDGWNTATTNRPLARFDVGKFPSVGRVRFGFLSRRSLRVWFNETERRFLARHTFVVGLYLVPVETCLVDTAQVAFDLAAAKRVRSLPL